METFSSSSSSSFPFFSFRRISFSALIIVNNFSLQSVEKEENRKEESKNFSFSRFVSKTKKHRQFILAKLVLRNMNLPVIPSNESRVFVWCRVEKKKKKEKLIFDRRWKCSFFSQLLVNGTHDRSSIMDEESVKIPKDAFQNSLTSDHCYTWTYNENRFD